MLVIAIGNPWRRDDGAAMAAAARIEDCCRAIRVAELTPELALEMAAERIVVFVDADIRPGEPEIRELPPPEQEPAGMLTHSFTPAMLVALARMLYGFQGQAWTCSIPGEDFGEGEGLTPQTAARAEKAAALLRRLSRRQAQADLS